MDNDLKDSIKKIEEVKKRQEKIEKLIILLAGIFALLIFAVVGVNIYYSGKEQVSEPKVVVANEKVNATYTAPPQETSPVETTKAVLQPKTEEKKLQQPKKEKIAKQNNKKPEKPKEQKVVKASLKKENPKKAHKEKVAITKEVKQKKENTPTKPKAVLVKPTKKEQHQKEHKKSYAKGYIYTIQVGAFSSQEKAVKFLKSLGLRGFIQKSNGIYRVFVGRFDSYREAVSYMRKHNLKGFVRKIRG